MDLNPVSKRRIHEFVLIKTEWLIEGESKNLSDFRILSSVQFSCSVVSDSLRPHELQHTRPPCPSPTPGVHSNSHPSSRWCHPAISSSVIPLPSCPQSLPASESFPMSQHFAWSGQSTVASALASFPHSWRKNDKKELEIHQFVLKQWVKVQLGTDCLHCLIVFY